MSKTCRTCRFFVARNDGHADIGDCRRYPPHKYQAEVLTIDWCGEWKAKPLDNDRLKLSRPQD